MYIVHAGILAHAQHYHLSLKNHGAEKEVDDMFDMGAETMQLPLNEKMKFEQGDGGSSFGYVLRK
jgi:hypothetical protein